MGVCDHCPNKPTGPSYCGICGHDEGSHGAGCPNGTEPCEMCGWKRGKHTPSCPNAVLPMRSTPSLADYATRNNWDQVWKGAGS